MNIDRNGNIWIGTRDGFLGKFDGQKWNTYDLKDFGFNCNGIFHLSFDADNNLSFIPLLIFECCTRFSNEITYSPVFENNRFAGFRTDTIQIPFHISRFDILAKFNGDNLTTYPLSLMPLYVYDVKADINNNLWLATNKGLIVFNEINQTA